MHTKMILKLRFVVYFHICFSLAQTGNYMSCVTCPNMEFTSPLASINVEPCNVTP